MSTTNPNPSGSDTADAPFSRLELERWALGVLEPERVRALEAARVNDQTLDARMTRIHADVSRAAEGMPQLVLPADDATEASEGWAGWLRWLLQPSGMLSAGLVAAALVLLAVQVFPLDTSEAAPGGNDVRYRGLTPELSIYRVRDGAAEEQGALIKARSGDRIQYDIVATGAGHLAVFNLQDDGEVQVYVPSRTVQAGEAFSSAVILDDYAGTERIFFVVSEEPVNEVEVTGAIQRAYRQPLADLDVLPGLDGAQRSVLILKEAQP